MNKPVSGILICANKICSNEQILTRGAHGQDSCVICGNRLSSIDIAVPAVGGRLLVERELSKRSAGIGWLGTEETIRWPGPVAFEYKRLREIMGEGNVEAACWKIANLAEVTVSYLFAAALEDLGTDGLPRRTVWFKQKKEYAGEYFEDSNLWKILNSLGNVMAWRNKTGVGHGSLVANKEVYIDSLLQLGSALNKALARLNEFLVGRGLSLADQNGHPITGPDYFFNLTGGGKSATRIFCAGRAAILKRPPALVTSHHFGGPDVYFIDSVYEGSYYYKNYRQSKSKRLNRNLNPSWDADPGQVAWLSDEERESWRKHLLAKGRSLGPVGQVRELLVDAAEQFQARGMVDQARWCMSLYAQCRPPETAKEELDFRLELAHYGLEASLGNDLNAATALERAQRMAASQADENLRKLAGVRITLLESWHKGVTGSVREALEICERALEDARQLGDSLPHRSTLYGLELKKNKLYLSRRLGERDSKQLRQECLNVFQEACELYTNDPDNHRIADIIGFACNLYGEYTLDLHSVGAPPGQSIINEIMGLLDFGEKIRARAYRKTPDDIWTMRGYAWSHHVRARLLTRLKMPLQALALYCSALKIRYQGERKYPADLGLKEDIIKNLYETARLGMHTREEFQCYEAVLRRRLEHIREKEGSSPRVRYLEKEINKVFS